jgi:glycosyltransferase involved in cell wall biosynthesis
MKQLKVLFYLLGDRSKASSRVRGFWIAEELENMGLNCIIIYGEERVSFLRCLTKLPWVDILFLQKRYSKWDYYLMSIADCLGKRTLFDIDDAYSNVKSQKTLFNVKRIMKKASAVTVGSQNLLEFAKQYQVNSNFLPTSIKLENYNLPAVKKQGTEVCLGWIGNGAHYHNDLIKILKEPLTEIASRCEIRLKLVGACGQKELYQEFSNIPGLNTTFIDEIDWGDSSEVRKAMADFDIGLYPVQATDFNLYKCGFKALEYMAMGIPVVANPVGANSYIVTHGSDGYHADGKEKWIDALTVLISDKTVREKMGQAGRHKVEIQYSITESAKKLTEIMFNLKN